MSDLHSETTVEDVEFEEYQVPSEDAEMRCPICLEVRNGSAGDFDHNRRWIVLQCCEDAVCRQCLRQHLLTNGHACPLNPGHNLRDVDVIAGCSAPNDWVKLEQRRKFREVGGKGFCCTSDSCAGILPSPPPGVWQNEPFPAACPVCHLAHCGRCGSPWPASLMQRHVCEDLRHSAEQREVQARVAAEQVAAPLVDAITASITAETPFNWVAATVGMLGPEAARARLDGVGLNQQQTQLLLRGLPNLEDPAVVCPELRLLNMLQEHRAENRPEEQGEDAAWHRAIQFEYERVLLGRRRNTATMRELENLNAQRRDGQAPIKNCPRCRHPTDRVDGCNIMTCTICRAEWCFICAQEKSRNSSCTHYHCGQAEAPSQRSTADTAQEGTPTGRSVSSSSSSGSPPAVRPSQPAPPSNVSGSREDSPEPVIGLHWVPGRNPVPPL